MFTITVDTSLAAFDEDRQAAMAKLLDAVSASLRAGRRSGVILDPDGERVGHFVDWLPLPSELRAP